MSHHLIVVGANQDCEITCVDQEHGKHNDEFQWICHDGDLEINFNKNGAPFNNGALFTASKGKPTVPKAKVKDKCAAGAYDYMITVRRPDKVCVKDPQIIIDETFHDAAHDTLAAVGLIATGVCLVGFGVKKLLALKDR